MDRKTMYKKMFANFVVAIAILLSIIFLSRYIISLFLPFILAYIITIIANPLIRFLEKKIKINRKYSSFVLICSVLAGIISIIYFGFKTLFSIIMELVNNVSVITNFINDLSGKLELVLNKLNFSNSTSKINIEGIATSVNTIIEKISSLIINYTGNAISFVPIFFIVFIITVLSAYFMLKEDFSINLIYFEKYDKFILIKKEVIDVINNYLKGQFKIMFIIFIILTIGFGILHIKYFVLVAFLTAFVDLLPIFGTGTILYPWIAISLLYGDYKKAFALFIIYIVAFVARQLLQPKIISKSIGLEPLPTLILMFIGFKIWGIGGLLFAPPIGLVFIKLYKIGIFDNYKKCVIYIYKDLKKFLKFNDDDFK